MANLPNFTACGYQVTEILHNNTQGGRITYKALDIATQKPVVIKQFTFATKSWDGYKQIEREIEVLQGLNHPNIPKYLNQFDPGDGLCFVQEYINAQPLSKTRSFSQDDIKNIAIQLLEILVYLQERIPPIFHRDIKPENILFDANIKVYLIDFGLARIGNNTMAASSIMGGTLGFMPPEQVHNQKLTEASDLYGLGATLICLITQTNSADIGKLVDFSTNKINFKDRVPQFSLRFIQWLEKMVEPNPANRYQNAKLALEELKPLYIIRIPEVNLDQLELNFVANSVNEKLTQTITITNNIPETTLQGKWSVSPHLSDPPHSPDSHSWISFYPQEVKGNNVTCKVTVDTSKLKADKNYQREIVFSSNARQENYYLKVKVKTAPIKSNISLPPYGLIVATGLVLAVISGILLHGWVWINADATIEMARQNDSFRIIYKAIFLAIRGAIFGAIGVAIGVAIRGAITEAISVAISGAITGAITGAIGVAISGAIFGAIGGAIFLAIDKPTEKILEENFYKRGFSNTTIILYVLLTTATGILTGIGAVIGFNPYLVTGLAASALPLTGMLIYPPLKLRQLKAEYRRQESRNLIEP